MITFYFRSVILMVQVFLNLEVNRMLPTRVPFLFDPLDGAEVHDNLDHL